MAYVVYLCLWACVRVCLVIFMIGLSQVYTLNLLQFCAIRTLVHLRISSSSSSSHIDALYWVLKSIFFLLDERLCVKSTIELIMARPRQIWANSNHSIMIMIIFYVLDVCMSVCVRYTIANRTCGFILQMEIHAHTHTKRNWQFISMQCYE